MRPVVDIHPLLAILILLIGGLAVVFAVVVALPLLCLAWMVEGPDGRRVLAFMGLAAWVLVVLALAT